MSNKEKIKEKVIAVVSNFLQDNGINTSSLTLNTNLINDYGLDSLDYIDLFSILEDEFDIKISNEMQNYEALFSLNNLVNYIVLKREHIDD